METIFQAMRNSDFDLVRKLVEENKDIVNSISKDGLSNDDGQSPLQVAIKTNNIEIANYLIERGANVNFIEIESQNEWKAPVIHDAIRCAIMNTRWNINYDTETKVFHTKEESDKAYELLKLIIEKGADVNAKDSYGNSCLYRAILDSKQILPYYDVELDKLSDDRLLTNEIKEDISRIFELLIKSGADINEKDRNSNKTFKETVKDCVLIKCLLFEIE